MNSIDQCIKMMDILGKKFPSGLISCLIELTALSRFQKKIWLLKNNDDIEKESEKMIRKMFPKLFVKQPVYSNKKVSDSYMDTKKIERIHDLLYSMSYLSLSMMVYK